MLNFLGKVFQTIERFTASDLDFPDPYVSDKMMLAFFKNQIGTEAGRKDVLLKIGAVNLFPDPDRKLPQSLFIVRGILMEI